MPAEPTLLTTARLWVLSDLHLAPPGDLLAFRAHEQLVSLLDYIGSLREASELVLNGDIFDFLQLPGYAELSLPLARERMDKILDALDSEPQQRNIVAALRRLTQAGHGLHCLPGNHDPELNLATVQAVLRERLGAGQALAPGAGEWRVQAGFRRVGGRHGHDGDPYNGIASAHMLAAQRAGDATVALPPGSRLVLEVINPYRRALEANGRPRFPFVDLLPSESAVVLALLYLDPKLAMKRIQRALGAGASALVRKVVQRISRREAQLGDSARGEDTDAAALGALADVLVAAMDDEERAAPQAMEAALRAYLNNPAAERTGMLVAGSGRIQCWLLRALCRALAEGHNACVPTQPDALAERVIDGWGRYGVAVTGHTHAAKHIVHEHGVYLNTGTWQDRLRVPAVLDESSVAEWLERLQKDELLRWRGCPVARIDNNGAVLLHWNGLVLEPWEAATTGC